MKYFYDTGSITLWKNVLTWTIHKFFSHLEDGICEIRTNEFVFNGCHYTLAIWPSGKKGSEDWFGVCLYPKDKSRFCDFIDFSVVDKNGYGRDCRIERSTYGLYRNEQYMLCSEFYERKKEFVSNGCLTMVCKMYGNKDSEFTSFGDDYSLTDMNDSSESVFVPSSRKFLNNHFYCPSLCASLSNMNLTVPQESPTKLDSILGYQPAVSSLSCSVDLTKYSKSATESNFGSGTAEGNLESKVNCKPDKKTSAYHNQISKKGVKVSRSEPDSKILINDKKVSINNSYLVKSKRKTVPVINSSCETPNNVEVLQSDDDIKSCKEVVIDDVLETSELETRCNLNPNHTCYMQKNFGVTQEEDDTNEAFSENLASYQNCQNSIHSRKPSCTTKNCLENVAEPDNCHISSCQAPYENTEVDIIVCDDSPRINTYTVKREFCSLSQSCDPKKPTECENNKTDNILSDVPPQNENPPATEFEPSLKLQNENSELKDDAESDIKEEKVATNVSDVKLKKLHETPNVNTSSTDTEKVAAKECRHREGVDETTSDPLNRSSLDGLKNMELKMAQILREMRTYEKLSEDYKNMYLDGKGSDVTINVGDRIFRVHKAILLHRSTGFAKFLSSTSEFSNIDVNICDAEVFHEFFLYLYSAKCESMSKANVFGLYCLANEYGVPDLKEECIRFMKNSLDLLSVCDIISLAEKYNEAELMEVAMRFFAENRKQIRDTDKWKLFCTKNPDIVGELFMKSLEILENNKQSREQ